MDRMYEKGRCTARMKPRLPQTGLGVTHPCIRKPGSPDCDTQWGTRLGFHLCWVL